MKTVWKTRQLLSFGVSKITMEHVKLANDEAKLEARIRAAMHLMRGGKTTQAR